MRHKIKQSVTPAHQESVKLAYDLFKHITTLSTGSILVLIALIEKVFKASYSTSFAGISLFLFLLTITISIFNMLNMVQHVREPIKGKEGKNASLLALLALVTFLLAILSVVIFAFINFGNLTSCQRSIPNALHL